MSRIRTIKPEFFTSEDIVELSPLARLLYVGLWCEADREGRMVWKPKTFKIRYLPADDCDIVALCAELVDGGLVELYGDGYAYIPAFLSHQHINPRESVSVLPEPPLHSDLHPPKVSDAVRNLVMARDGYKCVRCGSTDDLTLDHILPQASGGPHIAENLRCMCRRCNSGRPVNGDALKDDLAKDGFTQEGLERIFFAHAKRRVGTRQRRVATRADQDLTHREEGKGREWKGMICDAWRVPSDWVAEAATKKSGVDWGAEAERFRSHHLSKGSSFKNWKQAWWTWVNSPFVKTGASVHALPEVRAAI